MIRNDADERLGRGGVADEDLAEALEGYFAAREAAADRLKRQK